MSRIERFTRWVDHYWHTHDIEIFFTIFFVLWLLTLVWGF